MHPASNCFSAFSGEYWAWAFATALWSFNFIVANRCETAAIMNMQLTRHSNS